MIIRTVVAVSWYVSKFYGAAEIQTLDEAELGMTSRKQYSRGLRGGRLLQSGWLINLQL